MISKRNDHFSTLPPELLGEILAYLPLFHPWTTLSRVCWSWHKACLASDVLRLILVRVWDIHDQADSANINHSNQSVEARIRHIQASRLGRPFSTGCCYGLNRHEISTWEQTNRYVALKGSRFAWITRSHDQDSTVVQDLATGATHSLCGTARENITCIALSSKIVAFLTFTAKLYICGLSELDELPKAIRLPSAATCAFHADESMVAVVLKGTSSSYIVTIYDHATGQSRSFDFQASSHWWCDVVLVNATLKCIDIFGVIEDCSTTTEAIKVEHTRYSFEGKALCSSSWHRSSLQRRGSGRFVLGDAHPNGRKGQFMFRNRLIPTEEVRRPGGYYMVDEDGLSYVLICFDSIKARLFQHDFPPEHCEAPNGQDDPEYDNYHRYNSITLWKDIHYRSGEDSIHTSTEVLDRSRWSENGRYRRRNMIPIDSRPIVTNPMYGNAIVTNRTYGNEILVNESFAVVIEHFLSKQQNCGEEYFRQAYRIFCFEEELDWSTGHLPLDEQGLETNRARLDQIALCKEGRVSGVDIGDGEVECRFLKAHRTKYWLTDEAGRVKHRNRKHVLPFQSLYKDKEPEDDSDVLGYCSDEDKGLDSLTFSGPYGLREY